MSDTASTETASAPQVSLHHPGGELTLRTVPASEGAPGLDVSKLLATTGQVALDIGFVNTASCTSAITYIDGDAGILRYRGYPIDQLAGKASFVEVSYLLIYGELPTADQLAEFDARLRRHTLLHGDRKPFFDGRPRAPPTAHPAGRVRRPAAAAHAAARGPQAVLRRLPARCAPDAGALLGGQRAVDLLPGLAGPLRRAARGDLHRPAAGEAAHDRRLRRQEGG